MYSEVELLDAIDQINNGKHTIQNCEKLAAIYTVLDHLYGRQRIPMDTGYSNDNKIESEIGLYGKSEFLKIVAGKPAKDVWLLIDELVDAIQVLNPKLASNFMEKIESIR